MKKKGFMAELEAIQKPPQIRSEVEYFNVPPPALNYPKWFVLCQATQVIKFEFEVVGKKIFFNPLMVKFVTTLSNKREQL